MSAGKKLVIGVGLVVAATAYMAYLGGAASWKYYLTADECLVDAAKFAGQRVRVSGRVAPESLHINTERTEARFALLAGAGELRVRCSGVLPDNLAEGMNVVVEGTLDGAVLRGDQVMTRCASKYEAAASPDATPQHGASTAAKEVP